MITSAQLTTLIKFHREFVISYFQAAEKSVFFGGMIVATKPNEEGALVPQAVMEIQQLLDFDPSRKTFLRLVQELTDSGHVVLCMCEAFQAAAESQEEFDDMMDEFKELGSVGKLPGAKSVMLFSVYDYTGLISTQTAEIIEVNEHLRSLGPISEISTCVSEDSKMAPKKSMTIH